MSTEHSGTFVNFSARLNNASSSLGDLETKLAMVKTVATSGSSGVPVVTSNGVVHTIENTTSALPPNGYTFTIPVPGTSVPTQVVPWQQSQDNNLIGNSEDWGSTKFVPNDFYERMRDVAEEQEREARKKKAEEAIAALEAQKAALLAQVEQMEAIVKDLKVQIADMQEQFQTLIDNEVDMEVREA